jgi:Na+-transporting NADH:ubiquinone oxidoreductase subunit NqrC
MKKLKVILIVIWISVFLMILISAVSPNPIPQQKDTISKQDSIKKKTEVRMTDMQRKEMEQRQIMKGFDKSNDRMEKQLIHLDSLMGKKDTTRIKK